MPSRVVFLLCLIFVVLYPQFRWLTALLTTPQEGNDCGRGAASAFHNRLGFRRPFSSAVSVPQGFDLGSDPEPVLDDMLQWLTLSRGGGMVDVFRSLFPAAVGAFTCWNTLTSARATNYGTRIDLVLASAQLLPSFRSCR